MQEIDHLLNEIFQSTPSEIDVHVAAFCRSLNPNNSPLRLEPIPFRGSVPGECYDNVAAACKLAGGTEVSGWLIWYWPGVMLEAEHHMVMELVDGIVDVTPPPTGENEVLFLPDPTTPFDRTTRKIIPSRQMILAKPKLAGKVQAMIDASASVKALSGDTFGLYVEVEHAEMSRRQWQFAQAKLDLLGSLRAGLGRNDPCFCGRGAKYKKCHGATA